MMSRLPRQRVLACLVLTAVLAGGCAGGAPPGVPIELSNRDALPEPWLDSIPDNAGRCIPGRLGPADTLTLALGRDHPDQLAAVNPRDEWLYLVHDFRPSIMPPETFARRDTLRLPVGSTRAYVAVVERDTLERVFVDPGSYRFVLAGRLGTDVTQPVYQCVVEYAP